MKEHEDYREYIIGRLARRLFDANCGIIFGLGPWLMDLFAIGLSALAFTGLTMWWRTRRPL